MAEPLSPTQNSHTVSNVRVNSCPRTYLKQDEPEVIPISIPPSEAAKLAEDTSPRHVEYAPVSSIFEQATHNYQNTSVAFERIMNQAALRACQLGQPLRLGRPGTL